MTDHKKVDPSDDDVKPKSKGRTIKAADIDPAQTDPEEEKELRKQEAEDRKEEARQRGRPE